MKVQEPDVPPPPDEKARLEQNEQYNNHKRKESARTNLHKVLVGGLWISFIGFVIVFAVRVFHFILPHCWEWLTAEQLQGIDKLIFSGAIGGFVGSYFKKLNGDAK